MSDSACPGGYAGLSNEQVAESRAAHGANILTPPKKISAWRKFLEKFRDPLIIVLLIAGVLSMGISFYEYSLGLGATVFFEPVGIFVAIILATGLSFIFENRAEKEFAILNKINDDDPVEVVRNGGSTLVPRKDVVVGDIVVLNTGQEVPADGELLEAVSLCVDESTLTGEPLCRKTTNKADFDPDATFPSNMVLRGTKAMEGHAVMRVTAVGDATENGMVFEAAQIDDGVKTPLSIQLDKLGRLIAKISYGVGILIVVGRTIMYFATCPFDWITLITNLLQTVMIAVTLVVVAVPEGLPMAVTLSLAYSMRRMLKTNNLVRKLHACETMGAITVICTDKTGTLTQNKMQVADTRFFGEPDDAAIYDAMALNSTANLDTEGDVPSVIGNPTEGALLLWLYDRGVDANRLRGNVHIVDEVPFSTERKYMATLVENSDGSRRLFVKGAPEIVYGMCHVSPGVTRAEIDAQLLVYQGQAMRTLGFAYADVAAQCSPIRDGVLEVSNLVFLGIVGISDPVRADVPAAVSKVRDAGVNVKIVTGDTPGTAREIGRQIGLWDDKADGYNNIITGSDFAALTDEEIDARSADIKIIARARPMDKKRLVESLQRGGQVVAVTGDGTNDAPALKAAQVGLSMGDGTSVAKEASDITIIDNSFASIVRAVMWGRSLYLNIQRFILFQTTVNVIASLLVLCGAFMGLESPLTVTQMLWVNLIMDTFAAMALASLPPSEKVMDQKPRPRNAFIITRAMWSNILVMGLVMFGVLLGFYYYLLHVDLTSLSQIGRLSMGPADGLSTREMSIFFSVFVFMQFWNMFNARAYATGRSAFHLGGCGEFLFIVAVIFIGQLLIVNCCGVFFGVSALPLREWVMIIIGTMPILLAGEAVRLLTHRHTHG